eukprot:gene2329-2876_t
MMMSTKKVLVPITEGCEEMETIVPVDMLRRAGANVTVASIDSTLQIKAFKGINLVADDFLKNVLNVEYDLIVIPGGIPGAQRFSDCKELIDLLKKQKESGRLYAAICASPGLVLATHGLIENRATGHPSFIERLGDKFAQGGIDGKENRVVVDGNCITSRTAGTTLEFAMKLVQLLYGQEEYDKLSKKGCEEMETIIPIDMFRRVGANVTVASIDNSLQIKAARGSNLVADKFFKDVLNVEYDLIPGGMPGAKHFSECKELIDLLKKQKESGRLYSAICASPAYVLADHGLLQNKATCYPGLEGRLGDKFVDGGHENKENRVVVDGNCITSRSAGTTLEFAMKLVQILYGQEEYDKLSKSILYL